MINCSHRIYTVTLNQVLTQPSALMWTEPNPVLSTYGSIKYKKRIQTIVLPYLCVFSRKCRFIDIKHETMNQKDLGFFFRSFFLYVQNWIQKTVDIIEIDINEIKPSE